MLTLEVVEDLICTITENPGHHVKLNITNDRESALIPIGEICLRISKKVPGDAEAALSRTGFAFTKVSTMSGFPELYRAWILFSEALNALAKWIVANHQLVEAK